MRRQRYASGTMFALRQIIYVSRSAAPGGEDVDAIIRQSRHNNALDGVTGVLVANGDGFAQVLEGSDEALDATFARIRSDPRHRDLVVLVDQPIERRAFPDWSMALRRPGSDLSAPAQRLSSFLAASSTAVKTRVHELL